MERKYTTVSIDYETLDLIKINKQWYEKSQGATIKRAAVYQSTIVNDLYLPNSKLCGINYSHRGQYQESFKRELMQEVYQSPLSGSSEKKIVNNVLKIKFDVKILKRCVPPLV